MKKVNVIGTTGSGKSTFSKRLANEIGCTYIQLDELFWKPNWAGSTDEELVQKLEAAIAIESWVLDGNYNRTNDIKWQDVDTIIWLDFSYGRTFFQLFKRTLSRTLLKSELWKNTGNTESLRRSFMSRDSIFIWFFKCYNLNKIRYSKLKEQPSLKHIEFIRLGSPKEVNEFIKGITR